MVISQSAHYEVRCPLHGSIPFNDRERRIIDHPLVQRLRFVSQLGLTSLVYPGATHTRFGHSLGVMHLAGRIMDHLIGQTEPLCRGPFDTDDLRYFRQTVRLAGLLHDLGHPPFSHALEPLLPPRKALPLPRDWYVDDDPQARATHEDYSVAAVYALSQEEPGLLSPQKARDVCSLINARVTPSDRLTGGSHADRNVYPLLKQIISGEIDADRMDYLRRDAHYAGVTYGMFDLSRLIQSLSCRITPEGWVMTLGQNALYTYENFLMARFHMTMQVYFHKTLLPFDHYLKQAMAEGEIPFRLDGSLGNFLAAREDLVLTQLYQARERRWASRIVYRRPATRLIQLNGEAEAGLRERMFEALREAGVEVIHIQEQRRLSNLGVDSKGREFPIYVAKTVLHRVAYQPLHEVSVLLERYNQVFTIESLYCDPSDYDTGVAVLSRVLEKGGGGVG